MSRGALSNGARSSSGGSVALLLALAVGAAALTACDRSGGQRISPEEAVLLRQRAGLESLIAAARKGPLIPFQQVLVVLDESLIQNLLTAATPYERVVNNRFRVRVDSASVAFDDGFALVRLDGRASLADRKEGDVYADVSIYGGLDVVELDPTSGILRGRVNVMAFQARRVGVLGMDAPVRRLIEDLSSQKIEELNVLASSLEIPVRLEHAVVIPEIGPKGEIRIPAATVPLRVAVQDVKAYRGKLWVSIGVAVVPEGAEPGDGQKEAQPERGKTPTGAAG